MKKTFKDCKDTYVRKAGELLITDSRARQMVLLFIFHTCCVLVCIGTGTVKNEYWGLPPPHVDLDKEVFNEHIRIKKLYQRDIDILQGEIFQNWLDDRRNGHYL